MPRKQKQNEAQSHKIYVLISAISNEFYVGKTTATTPKVAYKFHAAGKHMQTKKLFAKAREAQNFPRMYLLEEINDTPEAAIEQCVVWTKYFVTKGLTPLAKPKDLAKTKELTKENKAVFDHIKELHLEAVICDERLLVSNYKQREKGQRPYEKKTKNKDCTVTLHLTPANHDLICTKAKEMKLSESNYCQIMALYGAHIKVDISEYVRELFSFQISLKNYFHSILLHRDYYPPDMAYMQRLVDRHGETRKRASKSLDRLVKKVLEYKKVKLENYRLKKEKEELEEKLKANVGS